MPDHNKFFYERKLVVFAVSKLKTGIFGFAAAPGVKVLPAATGVVISQSAQVYQPHIIGQSAAQVTFYAMTCLYKMY